MATASMSVTRRSRKIKAVTPTHALFDVNPIAITICKKGANGQRIFLKKEADGTVAHLDPETDTLVTLPAGHTILKSGDDWKVFYCVVAEPGAEEDCGVGDDAGTGIVDVWKSEDEIADAAHRLLKNKGYVNAMHDALEAEGCHIVENAVALNDIWVGDTMIKKGAWYIGIEPSPDFRAQVDAGEITGVSLEGTGFRESLIEKSAPEFSARSKQAKRLKAQGHDHKTIAQKMGISVDAVKQHLAKADKSPDAKIPNKPGKTNWLERRGGFPRYMRKVIEDLLGSHPEWLATAAGVSHAIQLGVGIVQNWAEGHDGKGGKVSAKTKAKAAAAVAEWERKKAGGSVKKADPDEVANESVRLLKQMAEESLLLKVARKLGIADDELPDELLKASADTPPTFAQLIASRELNDELPKAFNALQDSIWYAFYPSSRDSQGEYDPRELVTTSLGEFQEWAVALLDKLNVSGDNAASVKKALGIDPERLPDPSGTLEDEVDNETAQKLLKASEETNSLLTQLVTGLAEGKIAPVKPAKEDDETDEHGKKVKKTDAETDDAPITKADLAKALDDLLVEMATGASAQPDADDDVDAEGKSVKKTSDPLKGILA